MTGFDDVAAPPPPPPITLLVLFGGLIVADTAAAQLQYPYYRWELKSDSHKVESRGSYYDSETIELQGRCIKMTRCTPSSCGIPPGSKELEFTASETRKDQISIGSETDFLTSGIELTQGQSNSATSRDSYSWPQCKTTPCDVAFDHNGLFPCGGMSAGQAYCFKAMWFGYRRYTYDAYFLTKRKYYRETRVPFLFPSNAAAP